MRFAPVAAAALVAAMPAAAQTAFEGVVKYRLTAEGSTMDVTYMTKGDRVRSEMQMQGMTVAMLMDASASTMTTVMPSERMYMTMDLSRMRERGQQQDDSAATFTATGRKETIAGHECEHYLTGTDQNTDMCVATGLGYYLAGGAGGGRGRGPGGGSSLGLPRPGEARMAAFRAKFKNGFFPLRLTITEGGKVTTDMVVTSIERQRLSDELFTVPEGFTEMRMPGMPRN
jgi:hypothetical protein